ncbi:MAG TPA: peptide ABC transporter substrate-binding protein [Candidatus Cybelea sp.]|jgi:peptide/nickel transport system substrate-binding protein|nr:peptide ABC transporter substrate-binding protein [Candidatus Cybelea sp.]
MRALAALLLVFACALAGCVKSGSATGNGRHSWTQPGVLRVSIPEEPKNLNPLLFGTTSEGFIDRLMFEPLVSADARGNPYPMLAATVPSEANGGISSDGLTIVYHLRPNARWTDGVAVTARDVLFSWQAILNPNNDAVSRHGYDDVRAIDTPNAHTAVVHLKARFSPFVNTFFAESDQPYDVVPAHVLARYPDINHVPFDAAPTVSDGPFRFVQWRRGDRILLDANPAFFQGAPGLRHVEVHFVPNEDSAINLLRTHDIDYLFEPTIQTYPVLSGLPDAHIVWVNVNGFEGMEFNISHRVLADPRVRQAIAAALDKAALTQQLTHGQTTIATEDLPNWIWAFDPAVRAVPYDPAAAKRLLAAAGWTPGPDGILQKNGQRLELLLATDNVTATHRSESVVVQQALRNVGIAVEIKYYPIDVLYAPQAMGGVQHGGKFDLLFEPWFSGVDPDNSSQLTCGSFPPHGYDDSRYCSPAMDAAQAAALDRYDRPSRKAAYSRIEHLLARDNPMIYFWWQRQQEAISVDFHGFDPNPVNEAWNAWQWKI